MRVCCMPPCVYPCMQCYDVRMMKVVHVCVCCICCAVDYIYDLYLLSRCSRSGLWRLVLNKWARVRIILILLMLADLITYFATDFDSFRFSRPFRILLVISRGETATDHMQQMEMDMSAAWCVYIATWRYTQQVQMYMSTSWQHAHCCCCRYGLCHVHVYA